MQLQCFNRNWRMSICGPKCEYYWECLAYHKKRLAIKELQKKASIEAEVHGSTVEVVGVRYEG